MCVPLPRWNLDFSKYDKFISISCHPAPSQPFFLPLPLLKVHFHSLNFLPFSSSSIPTCCRQRKQVSLLGLVEEGPGRQHPAPLTFRKFSFFKKLSFFSLSLICRHLVDPWRDGQSCRNRPPCFWPCLSHLNLYNSSKALIKPVWCRWCMQWKGGWGRWWRTANQPKQVHLG